MNKSAFHPRLAYECVQLLSNHYPERLGMALCVMPGPAFRGLWHACKLLLPPTTAAKVKVIQSSEKFRFHLETVCSQETTDWLVTEVLLNQCRKTLSTEQRAFWLAPQTPGLHDPRGTPEYTCRWLGGSANHHRPHPNMLGPSLNQSLGQLDIVDGREDDLLEEEVDEERCTSCDEQGVLNFL
ncbi:unnamed protein product [Mesocestoides corti]|uniref:CRAL-TRIO domain-containing protein n=1 Tax=Mesocestoides corti TaxID=53468 RepID=A0A0R3U4A0_MESCO|nr:unnamed protein product [Mesocestoides corti]